MNWYQDINKTVFSEINFRLLVTGSYHIRIVFRIFSQAIENITQNIFWENKDWPAGKLKLVGTAGLETQTRSKEPLLCISKFCSLPMVHSVSRFSVKAWWIHFLPFLSPLKNLQCSVIMFPGSDWAISSSLNKLPRPGKCEALIAQIFAAFLLQFGEQSSLPGLRKEKRCPDKVKGAITRRKKKQMLRSIVNTRNKRTDAF